METTTREFWLSTTAEPTEEVLTFLKNERYLGCTVHYNKKNSSLIFLGDLITKIERIENTSEVASFCSTFNLAASLPDVKVVLDISQGISRKKKWLIKATFTIESLASLMVIDNILTLLDAKVK